MNGIESMSAVDRAWLLMERPAKPMMVIALTVLGRRLAYRRLCAIIEKRFLAFERFRCRPVADTLGGRWVPQDDFSLDDHVLSVALPGAAGQHELETLVAELAGTPLSPERPMWSFHLVEDYRGGSALIVRIHHCYADGIALVHVFLTLTEAEKRVGQAKAARRTARRTQRAEPDTGAFGALLTSVGSLYAPAVELLERVVGEGANVVGRGLQLALNPGQAAAALSNVAEVAAEVARIGALEDDPLTRLKQAPSAAKHVAWGEPLPFEKVREVTRALGCTVNDVVMSILAGAVGRYLESQGDAVNELVVRAAVPVNLRSNDDSAPELGNRFGLVFVELPIGMRHPLERLYAMRAQMQELKDSRQPLATLVLLATIGSLPAAIEDPAMALFSAKASLVVSNLPGPREQLYMAGVPVSQLLFWVPQAGSIGVGVSILTYRNQLQFGVLADRNLIPEPAALVRELHEELERLVLLAVQAPGAPEKPRPHHTRR
jgi:WS/DGAT/MGAT family acyltransferase